MMLRWMFDAPPAIATAIALIMRAVQVPGVAPAAYWWEFFPGWWMRFAVRDRRRLLWTVAREVIILGIQDDPPSPANFAM